MSLIVLDKNINSTYNALVNDNFAMPLRNPDTIIGVVSVLGNHFDDTKELNLDPEKVGDYVGDLVECISFHTSPQLVELFKGIRASAIEVLETARESKIFNPRDNSYFHIAKGIQTLEQLPESVSDTKNTTPVVQLFPAQPVVEVEQPSYVVKNTMPKAPSKYGAEISNLLARIIAIKRYIRSFAEPEKQLKLYSQIEVLSADIIALIEKGARLTEEEATSIASHLDNLNMNPEGFTQPDMLGRVQLLVDIANEEYVTDEKVVAQINSNLQQ